VPRGADVDLTQIDQRTDVDLGDALRSAKSLPAQMLRSGGDVLEFIFIMQPA
jgi:hypothetical protein